MAHKDYVRTNSAKKKTPVKKSSFPWKIAIVGLILLIGLALLIHKLNQDPDPQSKPEPSTTESSAVVETVEQAPKTNKPEAAKEDSIPPPPEEDWGYLSTLPHQEVEVEVKEVVAPKIPYMMQCGAYKTAQQANARKAKIAFQGISSKVVKKSNSSWYRIILGPYPFKRDAVKDQHALQRAKIEPCFIMRADAI